MSLTALTLRFEWLAVVVVFVAAAAAPAAGVVECATAVSG